MRLNIHQINTLHSTELLIDDEIIIITSNIKIIKDTPVLVVGNNKAVYLKDWLIREVRNYNLDIYDML